MKFLKYLSHYRWQILLLFAGLGLQVWGALELPTMMSQIVNRGVVGGDQHFILTQGGWMLLTALIGGCGMLIASFFASRIAGGLAKTLRKEVYTKTMSFSITELNQFSISSLITRSTNDVTQIQMVTMMVLRMGFQAPLMGIGAILKALDTAPSMTRIIMLAIASLFVAIATIFLVVMPKFTLLQKLVDKLNLVGRENLTGLRVVRAFNKEHYEEQKFEGTNKELTRLNLFVNKVIGLTFPFVQLVLNFTTLGIIRFGAGAIESGVIEVGSMMAFLQYAMLVMMSFMFLTMMFIMVPRATVSRKRITEVLNTPLSIQPPKHPQTPPADKHGEVEFRDVSFMYADGSEPVLNHVNFTAKAGQTTAFIGSTGSGKSTLINLIPRFYDVTGGQVLVDGLDVREYDPEVLMKKIGIVPQKSVLFSGTIASNIGFGSEDLPLEELANSARTAQASDFIEELEEGYDAPIAQGGSNVSGGQKQRLSIARVIAKKPEIYIFDDSFSALDFKTDLALRQALKPLTKEAAVLIIAQRVGTIKHADQIIVLDQGNIVGKGTHAELLRDCEVYREIASSQLSEEELREEMRG
ncbi:hypothetical protein AGMMS50249_6530 [candidate division SR1 bacterium]|nr:hypothetical protein AGMMS50249_6530 [candidate division SR1 bacterium]